MDGMNKGIKFLVTLVTGMVTGTMIGIIVISMLISYRIEQYHERINYLESIIEDKDTRLKKLEESINNKKYILKDVEIILIHEGDEIEKITLEKHIKEKYSKLLGKEVKGIDTDMAVEIINNRIMIIEDSKFKLKVDRLVLTEVLSIWISVEEEQL